MLSSRTPPSKPRLGSTSDASRLTLCRNVNRTYQDSVAETPGPSRYLSLITGGSLTHAALGGVSYGGLGNPESEVCHKTPSGSIPLIAVQKGGRSGGVTSSNVSSKIVINCPLQGGGVGTAAAEISIWPQLSSSGEVDSPARWAIARREPISPNTAMPATIKKSEQRTFRNRDRVNALFGLVVIEFLSRRFYSEVLKTVNVSGSFTMEAHALSLITRLASDLSW